MLHEQIHNTQRMLLMYTVSLDRYYTEFGIIAIEGVSTYRMRFAKQQTEWSTVIRKKHIHGIMRVSNRSMHY